MPGKPVTTACPLHTLRTYPRTVNSHGCGLTGATSPDKLVRFWDRF
jgi:hypothetical protein